MSKGAYFGIQALWSFVVSSVIWFIFFKNMTIDFYHNTSGELEGFILFVGILIYLILTILYIILGYKKVKNWKAWMILVSIVIGAGIGFLSIPAVVYGYEWIHKLL